MSSLLLSFYGDDFTGSTDALEVLSAAGIRTVLFTMPPSLETLAKYPGIQAVGLAGRTRSLSPNEMELELRPALAAMKKLRPRHIHYKVCSTFDSSAEIGSIGKAIEVGSNFNAGTYIPLVVGNPTLGRYCIFGNLFAQESVARDGPVYRLDRHPTVSEHPITPMRESDLRRHLAGQTDKVIALFDILNYLHNEAEQESRLDRLIGGKPDVVLFDLLYSHQLSVAGKLLDQAADRAEPLFTVGSSGVEAALTSYWQSQGTITARTSWPAPAESDPLLVLSGSCSPVTAGQIDWALAQGFAEIALDTCVLKDEDCDSYLLQIATEVVNLIDVGQSTIVHTCRGKNDPRLATSTEGTMQRTPLSPKFGRALGHLAVLIADRRSLRRVCIAGGDTASYASQAMRIESLEMVCPVEPGAPLCRVGGGPLEGVEICFKGGQVGREEFFQSVLRPGTDE